MLKFFKKEKEQIEDGTFRIVAFGVDLFSVEQYIGGKWFNGITRFNSEYLCVGTEKECEEYIRRRIKTLEEIEANRLKEEEHKKKNPPRIVPPYKYQLYSAKK